MDSKEKLAREIVCRIKNGANPQRIFEDVSYSKVYVDEALNENYGVSLTQISKMIDLSEAYEAWVKKGFPKFSRRNKIKEIKDFRRKFYDSFGFTLDEAKNTNLSPDALSAYVFYYPEFTKL